MKTMLGVAVLLGTAVAAISVIQAAEQQQLQQQEQKEQKEPSLPSSAGSASSQVTGNYSLRKPVRKLLPLVERLVYVSKLPGRLLRPPKPPAAPVPPNEELVQIQSSTRR